MMTSVLALKLLLVPSLIYLVTLAGRRWGPGVAGWLSAFPIVAGPILFTLTLEQGAAFAATAAEGTLLAVVAILVFSIAYAWASARLRVAGAMFVSLLAYGLAVAALQAVRPPPALAFAIVWGACLLALKLFPQVAPEAAGPRRNDLPWRMLAAAVLVLAVTAGATQLGARLAGFFAMFPVMSTVLVGFAHAGSGRASAVALLRGMVTGYFGFSVFCLVLALQLQPDAVGSAFALALGCALEVHLAARRLLAGDEGVTASGRIFPVLLRLLLIVFCVVFLFFGWLVVPMQMNHIRLGLASQEWPATMGIVESSRLEPGRRGGFARITYRYEIGGRTLRSDRIGTRKHHGSAQALVAAFPAGAVVKVYHDPGSTMSTLTRGVDDNAYAMLLVGALFPLVSLVCAGILVLQALEWIGLRRPFFAGKPVPAPPRQDP